MRASVPVSLCRTRTLTNTHTHTRTHEDAHIDTQAHTYTHTKTHTHTHKHTHRYTHRHRHTHERKRKHAYAHVLLGLDCFNLFIYKKSQTLTQTSCVNCCSLIDLRGKGATKSAEPD